MTFEDITARKHKGNKASRDANPSQRNKTEMHNLILDWLAENPDGLTSKEIAKLMNKPLNAISGRFSDLKALGLIEGTGDRREGAEILRIKE